MHLLMLGFSMMMSGPNPELGMVYEQLVALAGIVTVAAGVSSVLIIHLKTSNPSWAGMHPPAKPPSHSRVMVRFEVFPTAVGLLGLSIRWVNMPTLGSADSSLAASTPRTMYS